MDELFGLPTIRLMWGVAAAVAVIAAVIGFIAFRRPILMRMGLRNIPRRRAQTVLITLGLTLATVIVTISFSTGDSLATSIRSIVFDSLRRIDHLIQVDDDVLSVDAAGSEGIPQQVVADLQAAFADNEQVEAIFGMRLELVASLHDRAGQVEPEFYLASADAATIDRIGGIADPDGDPLSLSALGPSEIIINEQAARELAAAEGDTISLIVRGAASRYTVAAVAENAPLTGDVDSISGGVLGIDDFYTLLGPALADPGRWDLAAVTASGGVEGGLESSAALDRRINSVLNDLADHNPALYRTNGTLRFSSEPSKADAIESSELIASIFTSLFLFMGSFSVAAGILLIFLIFAMMAEERKSEMGIARAVGMQRNQLIQQFMSEGMMYNIGAAVIGVVIGLIFSIAMIAVLNSALDSFGFQFSWTVTLKSLVISGGIGTVITFITVVLSSFRASHLNIVAAIRDIPESQYEEPTPLTAKRLLRNIAGIITTPIGLALVLTTPLTIALGAPIALLLQFFGSRQAQRAIPWIMLFGWRVLQWNPQWWALFLIGGYFVFLQGLQTESLFLYMLGVSLMPLGLVMGLVRLRLRGRRLPNRLIYTLGAALVMFFWFIPNRWHEDTLNNNLNGGPELFVLAGAMLTACATLLLVFNLELIVGGVRRAVGGIGSLAPVIRTAAAYPAASKYRTGMTIAMIALITFALINFTTINASFDRAFTTDDALGGFEITAFSTETSDVTDIISGLEDRGADEVLAGIRSAGRIVVGELRGALALTVLTEEWDPLTDSPVLRNGEPVPIPTSVSDVALEDRDTVVIGGIDAGFVGAQQIKLQAISHHYKSEAKVWEALQRGDAVAVATFSAIGGGGFNIDGSGRDPWSMPEDVNFDATALPQIRVELGLGEQALIADVIAVIDPTNSGLVDLDGENGGLPTLLLPIDQASGLISTPSHTRHYIVTTDDAKALDVAQGIERELSIQATDIQGELERQQQASNSILAMFQAFIGVGLVAGLAALGVIAVRAVVERRQQIGVLRAIGFPSRLVGLELLLEMGFIAFLGLAVGTALALGLAWRLFAEGTFGDVTMYVPLGTVVPILLGSMAAALVLTYFPARQAARIPIAEALRYE